MKAVNIELNYRESLSKNGKHPDWIMIHPNNKSSLINDVNDKLMFPDLFDIEKATYRGVTIIWTNRIREHEIICTFNEV